MIDDVEEAQGTGRRAQDSGRSKFYGFQLQSSELFVEPRSPIRSGAGPDGGFA